MNSIFAIKNDNIIDILTYYYFFYLIKIFKTNILILLTFHKSHIKFKLFHS